MTDQTDYGQHSAVGALGLLRSQVTVRSLHIGKVGNPFAVGSGCFEGAVEHIGSDGGGLPLTQIRRQTPPSRACFEGLQPHQSFDPMQPARYPFGEQVVPHAPGAIGPVARKEAATDLRAEILVAPTRRQRGLVSHA